ncbi:terminase small subunit [Nesterenkonia halobia]|uniref:Terminase small subunit actinomycetes phage-type domain-containing protein n=1 Tax=Nesterenkonia halobia TaxID=37922 RepID=A0ABP6RHH1_9MICC
MAGIVEAFEETVGSCEHAEEVDAALIEPGRPTAARLQYAVENAEGAELTKTLHLMPHLMNVLREMRTPPAARVAVSTQAAPRTGSKLDQLRGELWGQAS